jgi:hypothetical protein
MGVEMRESEQSWLLEYVRVRLCWIRDTIRCSYIAVLLD